MFWSIYRKTGQQAGYDGWKAAEPRFNLYISALKKEIGEKIKIKRYLRKFIKKYLFKIKV